MEQEIQKHVYVWEKIKSITFNTVQFKTGWLRRLNRKGFEEWY